MALIKSFSVGNGDMFYIKHNSDSFTIIDCNINENSSKDIIYDIKKASYGKNISRFISTHPDQDHFSGIEILNKEKPIINFYVVKNNAIKDSETTSFKEYCALRDGDKAYYLEKGCSRKWLNIKDSERGGSGIHILWPDTKNEHFMEELYNCNTGSSYNNISPVIRYITDAGVSFMWIGDLETDFMEKIFSDINLEKTTVIFASHHGRESGKIPHSWLEKLDPQLIIIGEAPSRHLNYYTGYTKITQNRAGDILFDLEENIVDIYVKKENYPKKYNESPEMFHDFSKESKFTDYNYTGSIIAEKEYTLKNMQPQDS
ncbi:hypothetical protein JK217_11030 [Gluconobacter kondonii]|uniref:hypothetical protein n=1 Tax=Gluconobacter kondonii TaxID=941463 RepID=UPI001B8D4ED4|nr:hypothetical protein [Gluconobacter kondonii]MBS1078274.1 hypothetical protein [Gluconobacter kondonii]